MSYDQEKTQAPPDDYRLKERISNSYADCGGSIGTPGRPMTSEEMVAEFFKHHPPTPATLPKFTAINQAAKEFRRGCPWRTAPAVPIAPQRSTAFVWHA